MLTPGPCFGRGEALEAWELCNHNPSRVINNQQAKHSQTQWYCDCL